MPLIKSISGIRGTLKGDKDSCLTLDVIKKFTSSFIQHLKNINNNKYISIAVGRDGRVSGKKICETICQVSCNMGIKIIDCQMTTQHLLSLGAREIDRKSFLRKLNQYLEKPDIKGPWYGRPN